MRADFYLTEATTPQAGWHYACRLLGKAYDQKQQALVWCQDKGSAEFVDEMLWTYKDDSFIPHNLVGEGPKQPPPIQVAWDEIPKHQRNILLLGTPELPDNYTQFKRLILIVINDEDSRQQARELYKQLKAQGFEINTHNV